MSQPTVPFDLYGDTVTEGLGQIFGSIYDGDPTPLETLIEREDVNEYVRDAAIDVFLVLEHTGQLSREQVVGYFQRLFGGRLQRTHSHAWNGLVIAVGLDDRDQLDVLPGAGHRDEASGVIVDQADNGETNGIGFGTEGTSRQGEESDQENGERFHGEVSEISAPRMAQTERAAQPDQSAVRDRILGGLWGAVVGDALGVPVEFRSRAKCQRDPVTGLRGHGMHDQPAGTWSDDSSLLLCTVNSLLTGEFTHQHPRSRISCGFYCLVAAGLLRGQSVAAAHETAVHFIGPLFQSKALTGERHHFAKALSADLAKLPEAEIASGGHVVDTLTASLWCLLTSRNYEATVLKAVNLGGDTDTTAIEAGISGRDTPSPVDIDLGFHAPPEGANRRGMREPEKMRPAVAVG